MQKKVRQVSPLLFKFLLENSLELGLARKDANSEVESFAQLIKILLDEDEINTDNFLDTIKKASFVEDDETKYAGKPMGVFYKYFPVVINSDVLVKIVLLTQGNGFIFIVPENVTDTFLELKEDQALLAEKNINLSLYAEVYEFDIKDQKLVDLIKYLYIAAGNSAKAFELVGELALKEEEPEKAEDEFDLDDASGSGFSGSKGAGGSTPSQLFSEIPGPVETVPDIETNLEAYTKFKKVGKNVYNLLEMIYNKSSSVVRNNTRVSFIGESKAVLVIEVDNKKIYSILENSPKIAKRTLSKFGEMIRLDRRTQLVDSFTHSGKRYFVLVENLGNNYWVVKREKFDKLAEDAEYFEPIQKEIVKLNKSSIRIESRTLKPYKVGKKIVYTGDMLNEKRVGSSGQKQ